jgi:hypothetical protein
MDEKKERKERTYWRDPLPFYWFLPCHFYRLPAITLESRSNSPQCLTGHCFQSHVRADWASRDLMSQYGPEQCASRCPYSLTPPHLCDPLQCTVFCPWEPLLITWQHSCAFHCLTRQFRSECTEIDTRCTSLTDTGHRSNIFCCLHLKAISWCS